MCSHACVPRWSASQSARSCSWFCELTSRPDTQWCHQNSLHHDIIEWCTAFCLPFHHDFHGIFSTIERGVMLFDLWGHLRIWHLTHTLTFSFDLHLYRWITTRAHCFCVRQVDRQTCCLIYYPLSVTDRDTDMHTHTHMCMHMTIKVNSHETTQWQLGFGRP